MFWFSSFSASYSNRASLLARRPRFQQQQRWAGRRLARFLRLPSVSVTTEEKLTATTCRRHSPRQCMAQSTSHAAARWKVQQEISVAFSPSNVDMSLCQRTKGVRLFPLFNQLTTFWRLFAIQPSWCVQDRLRTDDSLAGRLL